MANTPRPGGAWQDGVSPITAAELNRIEGNTADAASRIGTLESGGAGYTDEQARDAVGAALRGTEGASVTLDDDGDTITIRSKNKFTTLDDVTTTGAVAGTVSALRRGSDGAFALEQFDETPVTPGMIGAAVDAQTVHRSGNETIAGTKTFQAAPVVPDASFGIPKVDGLAAALAAGGAPTIVSGGNLGATSTQTVAAGARTWLVGTLNADHVMTLALGAGASLRLLLAQDATGGRSLTLTDGTTTQRLIVPQQAGAQVIVNIVGTAGGFYAVVEGDTPDPDALLLGESTIPRRLAIGVGGGAYTLTSGVLRLGYFTARRSEVVKALRLWPGSTAAGATPTLLRWGVYEVAANGDLTLVAAIDNNAAGFASVTSGAGTYKKATLADWNKVRGQRYAAAVLCVTTATAPTIMGNPVGASNGVLNDLAPKMAGTVTGQSDLPASLAAASVAAGVVLPMMEMLPS